MKARSVLLCSACLAGLATVAAPLEFAAESRVPLHPRSEYSRYVNWRPADGEVVALNPPRLSWPYRSDWPRNWDNTYQRFRLQIGADPELSAPVIDVESIHNFYNTLPLLTGAETWYWRVAYTDGTGEETWSAVRRFHLSPTAVAWDRSGLAAPPFETMGHPRILFTEQSLPALRQLAETNPASRAALAHMTRQADAIRKKHWWNRLPKQDTGPEPEQSFYTIAQDLVTVCFVWRLSGDPQYADVLDNALTWAGYGPGGRSSPEGLGGDGHEDATQGNEFLALLFDWLYPDLSETQRQIMIRSLEWRTDHIMHRFSWSNARPGGPMIRVTFSRGTGNTPIAAFEAEEGESSGVETITDTAASGGRALALSTADAAISHALDLEPGAYVVTVRGCGPSANQDAFFLQLDERKPQRLYIQGWGEKTARIEVQKAGLYTLRITADPRELGMIIDTIRVAPHGDERLWLAAGQEWDSFDWKVPVPAWAAAAQIELFNYYAAGEVLWSTVNAWADARELPLNGAFRVGADGTPAGWRFNTFATDSTSVCMPAGGPDGSGVLGIRCAAAADRGAWGRSVPLRGVQTLRLQGRYRANTLTREEVKVRGGMAGCISSHQYEAAMDTAACGLALYEHSPIGRKWYDISVNYLLGISGGYGFDEAWNEGAGYGTSKCKWLVNAALYYDTTLAAGLGRSPYFPRLGEWFRRIIPVGMPHHAWGNQANASRGNHLAHFRKLAYLTGDGRFLYNWQAYGGSGFSTFRPWIEYVLPYFYAAPEPRAESRNAALFPIAGWAMAASGAPSDPETYRHGTGVIFQCRPRGGYGHSFNSDGSFQFHAYGELLNNGGGSSANGDAYAYHTMSHNTLLIDGLGQAQPTHGMREPAYGRIVGYRELPDAVYMAGDPTRCYPQVPGNYSRWSLTLGEVYQQRALPYLEHVVRHILFVKNRYLVIYDDIAASQPATYTWLYHIQPESPFAFDRDAFAVNYRIGEVDVRLQHVSQTDAMDLEDRQGLDGYVNPITGEDYRATNRARPPCAHNLWISNRTPQTNWAFLAVIYPTRTGESPPHIEGLGDAAVRVGDDIICFDPTWEGAKTATMLVHAPLFRPQKP